MVKGAIETKKGENTFFPFFIKILSMATQLRPTYKKSARGKLGELEREKLLLKQNIVENVYPWLCNSYIRHLTLLCCENYENRKRRKKGGEIF